MTSSVTLVLSGTGYALQRSGILEWGSSENSLPMMVISGTALALLLTVRLYRFARRRRQ